LRLHTVISAQEEKVATIMFKIGEFSTICRVPVSALRYYADIGLLEPAQIDRFTGYRYYSLEQLPRLNRILALKDLGLPLEQIKILLDENVSPDEIRGMLKLRQAEIEQHLQEEQARLERVAARLRQIEQEGKMPDHEVVLKKLDSQKVLSIREVVPTIPHIGALFNESFQALSSNGVTLAGPPMTVYHDSGFKPEQLDIEMMFPVAGSVTKAVPLDADRQLKVIELPVIETAACILHRGEYSKFHETYGALGQWIEDNGYRIVGPPREIYLTPGDSPDAMTEIQFPVEKA
jgi:DNA-binding transcriptional MerR regulator